MAYVCPTCGKEAGKKSLYSPCPACHYCEHGDPSSIHSRSNVVNKGPFGFERYECRRCEKVILLVSNGKETWVN